MIICITGLPGSGKTTVANIMKEKLGRYRQIFHLNTDVLRTELYKNESVSDEQFYKRDFTKDELARSYNGLYFSVRKIIIANPNSLIITDGTYRESKQRILLELIAKELFTEFRLIHVKSANFTRILRGFKRQREGGHSIQFQGTYEQPITQTIINNNMSFDDLEKQIDKIIESFNILPDWLFSKETIKC